MASASNSCAREKLASVSFDLASAGVRVAQDVRHHMRDDRRLLGLLLADGRVAGDDVAHFVRQNGSELGLVVGQRDQPARNVKLPVRQREGVDRRRVEDGDLVGQVRPLGRGDETVDGLLDQRLHARVVVLPAIGGEDARVLAFGGGLRVGVRRRLRQRQRHLLVVGRAGAGGEDEAERDRRAAQRVHPGLRCRNRRHFRRTHSMISICSGAVTSTIGPRRYSSQPRARMRRPCSDEGSTPAAVKSPRRRRRMVRERSRVKRRPKFT